MDQIDISVKSALVYAKLFIERGALREQDNEHRATRVALQAIADLGNAIGELETPLAETKIPPVLFTKRELEILKYRAGALAEATTDGMEEAEYQSFLFQLNCLYNRLFQPQDGDAKPVPKSE